MQLNCELDMLYEILNASKFQLLILLFVNTFTMRTDRNKQIASLLPMVIVTKGANNVRIKLMKSDLIKHKPL